MKNPALAIFIAFLCGAYIATVVSLGVLFALLYVLFSVVAIKSIKFFYSKENDWAFVYILTLAVVFALGLLRANYYRNDNLANFKPFETENVVVLGEVLDVADYQGSQQITILTHEIKHNNTSLKVKGKINVNSFGSSINLDIRDVLQVEGVLRLYEPMRFWGDFSSRSHHASKGVFAYINTGESNIKYITVNSKPFDLRKFGFSARRHIKKVIDKCLDGDEGALVKGIIIGDKSGFSGELRDAFSLSGMSHIVAVSGLHISIFIMFASFAVLTVTTNRYLKSIILLIAVFTYAVIVGDQPAVVRSALMAVYIIGLGLFGLRRNSLSALMFATFLMALYNPFILHNVGFQLSFAATLAIILLSDKFTKIKIANAALAAFFGTAPIIAYYFNAVTLAGLFTNILVSPLVAITLVLGLFLCAAPFLAFALAPILFGLARVMVIIAKTFANIEFLVIKVPSPSVFALVFCFALIYMMYKALCRAYTAKALGLRLAGAMGVLAVYFMSNVFAPPGVLVAFLPQTSGDCVHIQTPRGFNILIDAGNENGILPYLASKNISEIDAVLLTNYQGEDIRYLENIASEVNLRRIFAPKTFKIENPLEEMKIDCQIDYFMQNQEINLDGINFKVVFFDESASQRTRACAILKMTYGKNSILFLGAATGRQQAWAMEANEDSLFVCDILSLADHGSLEGYNHQIFSISKANFAVATGAFSSKRRVCPQAYEGIVSLGMNPFFTYEKGAINFWLNEEKITSAKGLRVPIEEDLQWH